ncbi:UNVERIFIED_CONTAM: hypothetical protein HDU68_012887 [Siphonaria sp. JEL0065]|nr:hypothetical protein HDU68_012887 [Siphonaria sp. JEL0065]
MNRQSHRTPIKNTNSFSSHWRSALKAKCLQRIKDARGEVVARRRDTQGSHQGGLDQQGEPVGEGRAMQLEEQGNVEVLLRQEYAAMFSNRQLSLNNDSPPPLTPELAEQLEKEMLDELRAFEELHGRQNNTSYPDLDQLDQQAEEYLGEQDSYMTLEAWVQAVDGLAVNHTRDCAGYGHVLFVKEDAVGNFLTCTGCDYFASV